MEHSDGIHHERLDQAKRLRQKMTPEERTLWHRLRTNKLNGLHFRRQHVVEAYIVDFYCPTAKLVVELDGPAHRIRREQDDARDEILRARGLLVLRIANADVQRNIEEVLQRIAALAGERVAVRETDDT